MCVQGKHHPGMLLIFSFIDLAFYLSCLHSSTTPGSHLFLLFFLLFFGRA